MSTLEKIVRPSQLPEFTPPRRTYESGEVRPKNLKMQIGRNGVGKTFNGSASTSTTKYLDTKINETRRQI